MKKIGYVALGSLLLAIVLFISGTMIGGFSELETLYDKGDFTISLPITKTMDVTKLFAFSNSSLLKQSTEDVPTGSYKEQQDEHGEGPVSTYVPFRNGLFLSAAASLALSLDCGYIYYGAHADDAAGNAYPDCTETFYTSMGNAIFEGSGKECSLEAPFINSNKADVVREGLRLGGPYQLTWSCYEGGDRPCGHCGTCIDRQEAFRANGIEDPANW